LGGLVGLVGSDGGIFPGIFEVSGISNPSDLDLDLLNEK
jgi:hypothetical protein